MGPGSRSLRSLVRDDEIDSIFQTANFEAVIARSEATKQLLPLLWLWIASLRSQ
jgi:hypothetical protein